MKPRGFHEHVLRRPARVTPSIASCLRKHEVRCTRVFSSMIQVQFCSKIHCPWHKWISRLYHCAYAHICVYAHVAHTTHIQNDTKGARVIRLLTPDLKNIGVNGIRFQHPKCEQANRSTTGSNTISCCQRGVSFAMFKYQNYVLHLQTIRIFKISKVHGLKNNHPGHSQLHLPVLGPM